MKGCPIKYSSINYKIFVRYVDLAVVMLLIGFSIKPSPIYPQEKSSLDSSVPNHSASYYPIDGVPVCVENYTQQYQGIIYSTDDSVIIAWEDSRTLINDVDIYAQKINSAGYITWGIKGVPICTANEYQGRIRMCSDGAGGAIIVWWDLRSEAYNIYAQRINANGIINWTLNGVRILSDGKGGYDHEICSDGKGGAFIIWEDVRESNQKIYTQHINSTGNLSWIADGIQICNANGHQVNAHITTANPGTAIITWVDWRTFFPDIYAQKIDEDGNKLWSPSNGITICNDTSNQDRPNICSDGKNGAYIIWSDSRTDLDIYIQKLDSDGSPKFLPNGTKVVGVIASSIDFLKIINDGFNGAFIGWGYRGVSDGKMCVQRLNQVGTFLWASEGVELTSVYQNYEFDLCSDSNGGVFTVWTSILIEGAYGDIFSQWINSTGNRLWTDQGIVLCKQQFSQGYPTICNNTEAKAFVSWRDNRNTSTTETDIYMQRISTSNSLPQSTQPSNFWTYGNGTEQIQWTITDNTLQGYYRIWEVDGTYSSIYQNWRIWYNNTPIDINPSRSDAGLFKYQIEYCRMDDYLHGTVDEVQVTVINQNPTSRFVDNVITTKNSNENISITFYDDFGGGNYQVRFNVTGEEGIEWFIWRYGPWQNGTVNQIAINRSWPGSYDYEIIYNDLYYALGTPIHVIVTLLDLMPITNNPEDISLVIDQREYITWILNDDFGGNMYRILVNDTDNKITEIVGWNPWTKKTLVIMPIESGQEGTFNYTIEFTTITGEISRDSVLVTITEETTLRESEDYLPLILSSIALIIGFLSIIVVIQMKRVNKKMITEIQKLKEDLLKDKK